MRLIANLSQNRHGYVLGYILFSQFSEPKPIRFLVDSGCSITTLLGDDVTRLSINCSGFQRATNPCNTANGPVLPYIIPNVKLFFVVEDGLLNRRKTLEFTFDYIECMQPTNPSLMTPQRIQYAYSLLGMDFLRTFKKWHFNQTELVLKQ